MKAKTHIVFGEIDKDGKATSYDKASTHAFCKRYPGHRIEITMRVIIEDDVSQQRKYYRAVCVPNVIQGLSNEGIRMNRDQAHDFLRQRSAIRTQAMSVRETLWTDADSTGDFDKDDWRCYIDEVIQFAAEELFVVIPEPIYERQDYTK